MNIEIKQLYLSRARKLRRRNSLAEQLLWRLLRNRRFFRYKFKRQYIIHPYIVDFICLHKKLIIELDGEHHLDRVRYDTKRTQYLENKGYRVVRFWNQTLFNREEEVLEKILTLLEQPPSPATG